MTNSKLKKIENKFSTLSFNQDNYSIGGEMCGKHGWFDSTYKQYNMTEYFSGWEFPNQEKHNEFLNIR